jgi:hypothetical protein
MQVFVVYVEQPCPYSPNATGAATIFFHLFLHHTHVVSIATIGLQAEQLLAMPECPPETRMHFLSLS